MSSINVLLPGFEGHVFANKDLMDLIDVLGFELVLDEVLFVGKRAFFVSGFGHLLCLVFFDLIDGASP